MVTLHVYGWRYMWYLPGCFGDSTFFFFWGLFVIPGHVLILSFTFFSPHKWRRRRGCSPCDSLSVIKLAFIVYLSSISISIGCVNWKWE